MLLFESQGKFYLFERFAGEVFRIDRPITEEGFVELAEVDVGALRLNRLEPVRED